MQKSKLKNQNWKTVCFSDAAEFVNGGALRHNGRGLPIIKIKQLKEGIEGAERTDNYLREEYRVFNGDFLMPWSTDLDIYKWNYEEAYLNQHIFKVIPKKKYDKNFVFYAIKYWRRKLATHLHGSTMQHIKREALDEEKFPVPQDIDEQKRIAEILSAFDDKIELNNKISRTLEEMAAAIFKEWFVKFKFPGHKKMKMVNSELGKIPGGWGVKKLGEVCDIKYGRGLATENFKKEGFPIYGGNGKIGFYNKYIFKEPQVIVGCRGAYSGNVFKTESRSFVTNNSLIIQAKENVILPVNFLFNLLRSFNVKSTVTGSAQPQITINELLELPIIYPQKSMVEEYEKLVVSIENKKINNDEENQKLASLRDLLLPKLMSGEVRV